MCEDIPNLAEGLGDLLREWCNASIDAVFYAWMLRRYSRTNKYTLAIIGYVLGAGIVTTAVSPNFGRLYKRQSENEGMPLLLTADAELEMLRHGNLSLIAQQLPQLNLVRSNNLNQLPWPGVACSDLVSAHAGVRFRGAIFGRDVKRVLSEQGLRKSG